MRFALPICSLMVLSLACNQIKSPTAVIRSASVANVTPEAITLNLDTLVSNPNPFTVPLGNTSYTFAVADTKILSGDIEPKSSVPASGSTPLTLPITISWSDLLKAKDTLAATKGNVPYTLTGKLSLASDSPLSFLGDKASVPLSYSGTLPLRDYLADPRIILNSPAAQELAKSALSRFGF